MLLYANPSKIPRNGAHRSTERVDMDACMGDVVIPLTRTNEERKRLQKAKILADIILTIFWNLGFLLRHSRKRV